jgi:hypothetical protein
MLKTKGSIIQGDSKYLEFLKTKEFVQVMEPITDLIKLAKCS